MQHRNCLNLCIRLKLVAPVSEDILLEVDDGSGYTPLPLEYTDLWASTTLFPPVTARLRWRITAHITRIAGYVLLRAMPEDHHKMDQNRPPGEEDHAYPVGTIWTYGTAAFMLTSRSENRASWLYLSGASGEYNYIIQGSPYGGE